MTLICGCSSPSDKPKSNVSPSPEQTNTSPAQSQVAPPLNLKVNGFYLGMPIAEAESKCREMYKPTDDKCTAKISIMADGGEAKHMYGGLFDLYVGFSLPDEKANKLRFSMSVFNATDMQVSDFAKKFIDNYGIPELKASDSRDSWLYISPSGLRVKIEINTGVVTIDKASTGSFN